MANTINQGTTNSVAYYPAAGTDIDDTGPEFIWDNNANRVILSKSYTSASDALLSLAYAGTSTSAPPVFFVRTRGTISAPVTLQNADRLPALTFVGRGLTAYRTGAYVGAVINGTTINDSSMPTDIVFGTNNGTGIADRAKLNKDGEWQVNVIKDFFGGTLTLNPTSTLDLGAVTKIAVSDGSTGQFLVKASNGRLAWASGSSGGNPFDQNLNTTNDVAFRSVTTDSLVFSGTGPVAIDSDNDLNFTASGNITFNGNPLPSTLNSLTDVVITNLGTGQILQYNGTTWVNANQTGGGTESYPSRMTKTGGVNSLAPNSEANIDLDAFKGYALYQIQVSHPAWVRMYSSSAARTADQSRAQSTDPLPSAGVLTEVITSSSNEILSFSPALMCYNNDSTVNSNAYIRVKNLTNQTVNLSLILTVLQMEE